MANTTTVRADTLFLPHRTSVQGSEGFEKHMDHLMELCEYMVEKIKSSPDKFYLLLEPEMVNVSFWYVPKRLRNVPHGPKRAEILGQVSSSMRRRFENMEIGTVRMQFEHLP